MNGCVMCASDEALNNMYPLSSSQDDKCCNNCYSIVLIEKEIKRNICSLGGNWDWAKYISRFYSSMTHMHEKAAS